MWEDSETWDGQIWWNGRNRNKFPKTRTNAWYTNQTNTQNWEWWPQAPRKVYNKDTFKPTAAFHSVVASEWIRGTETVSKAAVLKALSDGADFKGNLLILHSPEQICELRDLWKSLSCERSLTVVAPQTSTEVFEGTVAKVTVRRNKSATSLEHVVLWAPGPKDDCTWPKPAVKNDFAKFVSAPQAYRNRFLNQGESDSPAKLAKEVASRGGGNSSFAVHRREPVLELRQELVSFNRVR